MEKLAPTSCFWWFSENFKLWLVEHELELVSMLEEYLGEQNWCFADCSKRNYAARAIGRGALSDLDTLLTRIAWTRACLHARRVIPGHWAASCPRDISRQIRKIDPFRSDFLDNREFVWAQIIFSKSYGPNASMNVLKLLKLYHWTELHSHNVSKFRVKNEMKFRFSP